MTNDRVQFLKTCRNNRPAEVSADRSRQLAKAILRDSVTVRGYALECCNRELSTREVLKDEAAQARIIVRSVELGCTHVEFRDPRGMVVHLFWPLDKDGQRPYNTMGGNEAGYGVAL